MNPRLTRRAALKVCLAPVGIAASSWLTACSSPKSPRDEEDEQVPDASVDASSGRDASTPDASGDSADARAEVDARTTEVSDAATVDASTDAGTGDIPWASGGTSSMAGNYPDPFAGGAVGAACALYPAQTLGPCYASPVQTREDISDGEPGLPMRMSFLVVESDGCTPVPNAEVDVWSAGSNGVYSAFASGVCNPERLDVVRQRYCRGKQTTDANGRVDFSTVFPGWYTGRTIHIHFTVRAGGREFITSQLYFDDALSDEIMKQVDYADRGARDTNNRGDSVLRGASNLQPVLFETAKRADGVLHAWKVLSIRS